MYTTNNAYVTIYKLCRIAYCPRKMSSLFSPINLGSIECSNRVIMSPLTRARSDRSAVPNDLMAEYYAQRATAGLIISEATAISPEGHGWPDAPGIWTVDQVKGWKKVTDAAHARGGKIVCQLWHMGRCAHSDVTNTPIVAPSPIPFGKLLHVYDGEKKPAETPKELTKADIARIIGDYASASKNAIAAGFDGVQLHAANGYLVDEFFKDSTNNRTDEYGTDRTRFLREVVEALVSSIGAEKVGVRFSPTGDIFGAFSEHPELVMIPAAKFLQDAGVSWLELREPDIKGTFESSDQPKLHGEIRKVFKRPLILNQDYTRETAMNEVETGEADGISFGRAFISNPDLVRRFKENLALSKDNVSTWYVGGPNGYVDYPEAE